MDAARSLHPGWQARLRLTFRQAAQRSVLAEREHFGPLLVQRPFYPEGGLCHCYLIHPPGGVVGGDRIELDVSCERGAQVLLTTPGASRFYYSSGALVEQRQELRVSAEASLEWLPQEAIVFNAARVDNLTRIELEEGARFLGWEITCMGRPASGERWSQGRWRSRFELYRAGRPLLLERNLYRSGSLALNAAWGMAGFPVQALFVMSDSTAGQLEASRASLAIADTERLALTRLQDLLVCRYLGHSAERAKNLFIQLWTLLRPQWLGQAAVRPRIWAT